MIEINNFTNIWKRLILFIAIDFLIYFTNYFILQKANAGTPEMAIGNLIVISSFPLLVVLFIRSIKSNNRLKFSQKILPVICLVISNLIILVSLNLFNFFNRTISINDIKEGFYLSITLHLFFMLPVAIIIALIVKTRLVVDFTEKINEIK